MDLVAIPPPRPDDVVKAATDPMLARSRSLRLWCSLGMMTPSFFMSIVPFFAPSRSPADATPFQMLLIFIFWGGLLPAAAMYWYFSAGMKRAPKLVRNGVAIPARIVRFLDGGGAKYFTFAWIAGDGREHRARLKATDVKTPMQEGDAVTVLASSDVKNQVGVILGDNGLYVADGD